MAVHLISVLYLLLLCHWFPFSRSYTLLYQTENSPSMQSYDCMYVTYIKAETIKYCRQLNESQPLQRRFNQSCHNGGQLWSFEELNHRNISTTDVLAWSSSMEQTDRYSKYLSNFSLDVGDRYLCNCTKLSSFGKFCEYEFYNGESNFTVALFKQFEPLEIFTWNSGAVTPGSQLHNNRPCYRTFECDSGSLCLDWRYICDGKQQCMDGVDEDHCEVLEFNECEDDEYRCANGMCIPEEYWLDGDYDCMDWTDETGISSGSGLDCFYTPSLSCDEHVCLNNQWSCGDGRCIGADTDRHTGIRHGVLSFCQNLRDVQYMCESVTRGSQSWWTIDGGYCLSHRLAYRKLDLDKTPTEHICTFAIKCALSNSLNEDCTCKNTADCRNVITNYCGTMYLRYPVSGPIISPYLFMFYLRDGDWTKKKPEKLGILGRIKCLGYQLIVNNFLIAAISETSSFYEHRSLDYTICDLKEGNGNYRNYLGPQYDIDCWNNSKTFNHHPYQVAFLCPMRCLSKYRLRDGIDDCFFEEGDHINNSCPQIQRHRLQCSSSQLTCLLPCALGNSRLDCSNKRDEVDSETGRIIDGTIRCEKRTDPECVYLQNYIRRSSLKDAEKTTSTNHSRSDDRSISAIQFRRYCDSFFDLKAGYDELPELCREWICPLDQYQCLCGQCIPSNWICDGTVSSFDEFCLRTDFDDIGEWDCSDGSDEQRLFIIDHLSEHNSRLINLTRVKQQCYARYRSDNIPFSDVCDIRSEYPCFRTGVGDPFNVTVNRPCIDLKAIGDGKTDCVTGLDERNRLDCGDRGMLGFHFQYNHTLCVLYPYLCHDPPFRWTPGNNDAYSEVCFYRRMLPADKTAGKCNGDMDVMCLNDTCIEKARCNGRMECAHGEDEYRCVPPNRDHLSYRWDKQGMKQGGSIMLPVYPSTQKLSAIKSVPLPHGAHDHLSHIKDQGNSLFDDRKEVAPEDDLTSVYGKRHLHVKSTYEIVRDALPNGTITFKQHYLPFICNRGAAVKYYTGHTVCFCPPSAYGSQCEFYNDRIMVQTHLNLTNYRPTSDSMTIIKVLVTFLFHTQIIDYHEFHVHPSLEKDENYLKHYIYFLYPRTEQYFQIKQTNRSGTQLYSVRFEAFDLHSNGKIEPIGVWHYRIYFDFLPSLRLSKILHFYPPTMSLSNSPCLENRCGDNGVCEEILNSNHSSYFCSCSSGYYGTHCQSYDTECNRYCSLKSICKPEYRKMITGNQRPLCLCPTSTFGSTCFVKNSRCESNPCLHGGTCVVAYDATNTNNYLCVCSDVFEGNHCQRPRRIVHMTMTWSSDSMVQPRDVLAVTVSYSNTHGGTLALRVEHQQVFDRLPSQIQLIYNQRSQPYAPQCAVMKVYGSGYHSESPKFFILYLNTDQKEINVTTDLTPDNHCPLFQTLEYLPSEVQVSKDSQNSTFNSTTAVFYYHRFCRSKQNTNRTFICFRDLNYLCICDAAHYRAECFGYNPSTDQCSKCLSSGYCLKGEESVKDDFLCLCPRCYHGKMCQYSTELMSFTLDSLIVKDIQGDYHASISVYISVALIVFLSGLFNNLNSFLTFLRPKARKFGVGNYLLLVSIIDQCSLLLLLFKLIHIILGSNGTLFAYERLNLYSCKLVSYLLSVCTRITYWLTSFVTTERLCVVLFPTSTTLKNPRLAFGLSAFALLMVCGMHVHEVLFYATIEDLSSTAANVTLCVTHYTQSLVSTYNHVNLLLHYFIPFLIQTISITIMIVRTAGSRARTSGSQRETFADVFRKQLKAQKELYLTPLIIILSSLPQMILSFSYVCDGLNQSWKRYSLLAAYFFSYLPQILGFILYVLPSTAFFEEFRQTPTGKRLLRQRQLPTVREETTITKTKLTKPAVPTTASFHTETKEMNG